METLENKKILIIEDEPALQHALQKRLEETKVEILVAQNGEDGLAMALKEHPDLILLDIIMPRMEGIAMAQELRKDEWGKDAPIVVLTNLTDVQHVQEALASGIYEYLVKTDISLEEITEKVIAMLK